MSGSDTSGSSSDGKDDNKLSALLKKEANISQSIDDFTPTSNKRQRGPGKPPLLWFQSKRLPTSTRLGVYRAIFPKEDQIQEASTVEILRKKQLAPVATAVSQKPPANPPDGGVALPKETNPSPSGPHVFLCMIGGGHFAAMVVSLAPKMTKNNNADSRQATVIAHKTFHRYTTRRKQGGAQSSNDSAKGAAHSAGASIRRYNETALVTEVRALLAEWKAIISSSELLFIRATGSTNRSTLFGSSADDDARPLRPDDPRLRGFPFSTRRATEAELMRCFVELTRMKVHVVDEEAEARAAAEADDKAKARNADEEARKTRNKEAAARKAAEDAHEQEQSMHTNQITALIRRSKAPALLSYLSNNQLDASYCFYPPDHPAHYHAPTALHLAANLNASALVTALLVKGGADPTVTNLEGQTAFDIAGDRAARDAFRVARGELGDEKWDWEAAHVPFPVDRDEVTRRAEAERVEKASHEAADRKEGLARLKEEEAKREEERRQRGDEAREKKMGKGKLMGAGRERTAEERRAEEARGMTPELRMRMEREKRARAADERMRRMQGGPVGGSGRRHMDEA